MNYTIIPDSQLTVDALLNTNEVIYTESEVKLFSKTPWTWHTISKSNIEKNKDFYFDAGHYALLTVVTLDNAIQNVLNIKERDQINIADINISKKISEINELSSFLGPAYEQIENDNVIKSLYDCKIRGFIIANFCQGMLSDESYLFHAKSSDENKLKYHSLLEYLNLINPDLAYVKGSYTNYISSNRTTPKPSDIDIPMIISNLNIDEYYRIMSLKKTSENIEIRPLLIPSDYSNGCTFFDLDVNEQSEFIEGAESICLRKSPEKIIRSVGNMGLEKTRSFLVDDDKIESLRNSLFTHRKIYSAIRQPEMFFKKLKQFNLDYLVDDPIIRRNEFRIDLPLLRIKEILAESSIDISRMNQKLNEYIENKS